MKQVRHVAAVAVTLAGLGIAAEGAAAAVTAGQVGSIVEVQGDGAADVVEVTRTTTFTVTGVTSETAGACELTGTTLTCTNAITRVEVSGGEGDDRLVGAFFAALDGEGGNDTLELGAAPNGGASSIGFSDDDTGGAGNDTLNGGPRSYDRFQAEPGADRYVGGTNPDPSPVPPGYEPQFNQGNASDSMEYGGAEPVAVSLDGVANDGRAGEGDDVGADVESIDGSSGNDVLTAGTTNLGGIQLDGGDGDDRLTGGPLADSLRGGAGSDVLVGGGGDDTLDDGDFTPEFEPGGPIVAAGNDVLDGGEGNDFLETDRGNDTVSGGGGRDLLEFSPNAPQPVGAPFAREADVTISLDDVANDGVAGQASNFRSDVEDLDTGDGNDTLVASAASNRVFSDRGDDTITLGGGADAVLAGPGNDTIKAADALTDDVDCGRGTDSADVDLAGGQPGKEDATVDCETITGTPLIAVMPVADIARPVLKFRGPTVTKVRTFLRTFTLSQRVSCGEPCAVAGEIRLSGGRAAAVGDLIIGTGALRSGPGERTLRVKVARKYQQALRRKLRTRVQRRRGIVLQLRVQATDAAGNVATTTRRLRVRG